MLLLAALALAHPMGTLSTNRSAIVLVRPDETRVRYTVDLAEVPSSRGAPQIAALLPGLSLSVDGRALPLAVHGCSTAWSTGEGALPVVTLLCELTAPPVSAGELRFSDANFAGTPGWRELRLVGEGVPLGDADPPGVVSAAAGMPFSGADAVMALDAASARVGEAGDAAPLGAVRARGRDALLALVGDTALTPGFVAWALLAAVGLGAGHALSPGHGKTLVAAYLVGARGTVGQALLLGLAVTVSHVASVLALGVVTLALSEYVVAERLLPWIGAVGGLAVIAVGAGMLRSPAVDDDDHDVVRDDRGEPVGLGRLLVLGITGGTVPCPSALVVLLAAISLHRIAFGLALIVAFSAGLAAVLVGIGVLVVRARPWVERVSGLRDGLSLAPRVSAAVVLLLGVALVVESLR